MEGETELEMVQRHVREGDQRIKSQVDLIAQMRKRGTLTDVAIGLLDQFKDTQRLHKAHLARLETGGL